MNQGLESDIGGAHQTLKYTKAKMREIIARIEANQGQPTGHPGERYMRLDSLIGSYSTQSFSLPADCSSVDLKQGFNSLFLEARAIDRAINPHPMTRMPVDIVCEIFEAAARADPDTPFLLTMTCEAWKRLVINTSKLWSDIRINVDNDDVLESLHLSLLLSKTWPLDIAITGGCASDEIANGLTSHVHRIRALELSLHREARVPFRVLGGTPPDGLRSLRRLAIEPASYNENTSVPSDHPLERAGRCRNTINVTDLFLIKSLPLLSSLNALVLHVPGIVSMDQLQLPRVESLRLVMKDSPMVLENLACSNLKNLDVVLDDTSREGWWDLLTKSLTYPRLESLAVDVTLDRLKNEWSKPWDSYEFKRLAIQPIIRCVIVALSFSDRKYFSAAGHEGNAEYLCGDLLRELTESVPSLKELRLLHVPYLHAPFIWPSPEVLWNLQQLEMQVPAIVYDEYIPVIDLPKLRELRYYGYVTLATTQLPRLRTPSLEYLEIMHNLNAIHPILGRVDKLWPNMSRRRISYEKYGRRRKNSSKDFPTNESLPNPKGTDLYLPVIHQSVALRELRLYLGNELPGPQIPLTRFPELRVLHCSLSIFRFINAPKLEELHLLWQTGTETPYLRSPPSVEWVRTMLRGLVTLDLYSHFDPRFHGNAIFGRDFRFDQWMHCLHSLQTLILSQRFASIDDLINCLWNDPTLCPRLATIDSFGYPRRWSSLRDCIEKRNHLAMRDSSVHPIRTLRFPLAPHRNILDRLKESLSGEFAGPFVAVPLQPYALEELIQPDDEVEKRPETWCFGCIRSGNAFECLRPEMKFQDVNQYYIKWGCARHWNRGADQGVTITAYNIQLSGYLEGA
jgi:hypothetical protein